MNWCLGTVILEKTLESPLACKEIKPVNPKGKQTWIFIGSTEVEAEALILWPPDAKSWLIGKDICWQRLRAGEEGDRGWDGWMVSPTQWTWVWANYRRWWWTGRPGVLQPMGSQRVGRDLATMIATTTHSHVHIQGSPEKQNQQGVCLCVCVNGAHANGGWEVPAAAVGRLRTQDTQCYSSRPSLKAWEPGRLMLSVPAWSRKERASARGTIRWEGFPGVSAFLSHSGHRWTEWGPPTLGRAVCFLLSLQIQNISFIQERTFTDVSFTMFD